MIPLVEDRLAEVAKLCERYGVERLDLSGAAAGEGFDPNRSDLDFVVSFERRDRLLRQAVERNLEIIGEAIGRIARLDAATASRISEHGRVIAFRNHLIHGYDLLDDELVWDTVQSEVPVLFPEVEGLLRERGRELKAPEGGDLPPREQGGPGTR